MTPTLWLIVLAIMGAAFVWFLMQPAGLTEPRQIKGRVSYVVDGDSLYLKGHKAQVRLWGVDAPERGESGFQAATDALYRMAHGQRVTCRVIEPDKYGRNVARCFLPDGREINRMMIEGGTVREYRRFSKGFYGR